MTSVSRSAQFAKVSKVLKKHYESVAADPERPVLEHLLFACCLEDSHYQAADEAFAAVVHTFFDFNEVRVTSIAELAETMGTLPDPRAAANRLKRVLQSVFEATYAFHLEDFRKQNLGPTIKWLKKLDGTSNFTVAYVVQSALGGHAIAIDSGTLAVLRIVELVCDKDVEGGVVPGLERAIAKSKGVEFSAMLHQFGADFTANPYSPKVRKILLEINPDVKDQLPKRRTGKQAPKGHPTSPPKKAEKEASEKGKSKRTAKGKAPTAKEKSSPAAQKPPPSTMKKASSKEKTDAAKAPSSTTGRGAKAKKKEASERISKRKPR